MKKSQLLGAVCAATLVVLANNAHATDDLSNQNPYASFEVTAVPLPAAAWLFGYGLLGLIGVSRRTKA